jgi:hypothetical protein
MEAFHLSLEGMQEGSFEAQILTLIPFTSAFVLFLPWPKNGLLTPCYSSFCALGKNLCYASFHAL